MDQYNKWHKWVEEATEAEIDLVPDLEPSQLPFGHIFGDKKRILAPMDNPADMAMDAIIRYLRDDGWYANFTTKQVTQKQKATGGKQADVMVEVPVLNVERTVERVIPKGPRAGERTQATERIALGKLIQRTFGAKSQQEQTWTRYQSFYTQKKNWAKLAKMFDGTYKPGQYVMLYTRNPKDVLRMSDFEGLTSCHTPPSRPSQAGHSYFQCAAAEAQGLGGIAYMLRSNDLLKAIAGMENVAPSELKRKYGGNEGAAALAEFDLDRYEHGELFDDDKRQQPDAPGPLLPKPDARIRLRKMVIDKNDISNDLAVPETRVYGHNVAGLRDAVLSWAQEKQIEQLNHIIDTSKKTETGQNFTIDVNYDRFTMYGGTYTDTKASIMLKNLLTGISSSNNAAVIGHGNVRVDNDAEHDILAKLHGDAGDAGDAEANMLESMCTNIMHSYEHKFKCSHVGYDIDELNVLYHYAISTQFPTVPDFDLGTYGVLPHNITMKFTYNSDDLIRPQSPLDLAAFLQAIFRKMPDVPADVFRQWNIRFNDGVFVLGYIPSILVNDYMLYTNTQYLCTAKDYNSFCAYFLEKYDRRSEEIKKILDKFLIDMHVLNPFIGKDGFEKFWLQMSTFNSDSVHVSRPNINVYCPVFIVENMADVQKFLQQYDWQKLCYRFSLPVPSNINIDQKRDDGYGHIVTLSWNIGKSTPAKVLFEIYDRFQLGMKPKSLGYEISTAIKYRSWKRP